MSQLTEGGFNLNWGCPCADWPRIDHFNVKVTASDGVTDRDDNYSFENCESISESVIGLRSCMQYNISLTAHAGAEGTEHDVEAYREKMATTLESVPTRPTALTVTSKSTTALNITWMPPIEHKECVKEYRVCYKMVVFTQFQSQTAASEICNVTEELNFALEDLEPCAQYRIRVTALTANGRYSLDSVLEESTDIDIPGMPTTFTVIQMVNDKSIVGWNRPIVNPWCVKGYAIEFYPLEGEPMTSTTPASTTTVLQTRDRLKGEVSMDSSYLNLAYDDDELETTTTEPETTTTTQESTPPTRPTEEPTKSTVETTPETTEEPRSTSTMSSTTTENILDEFDFVDEVLHLEYCTYYNFTLKSVGYEEIGSSAIVSQISMTDSTPEIAGPNYVSVYDTTTNSMMVTWYPPENHFNCLETYQIIWQSLADASDHGSISVYANVTTWLLDTLSPCSTYSLTVRAIASDPEVYGDSTPIRVNTLDEVPEAPQNLVIANVTQYSFDAHWCPPQRNPQCSAAWRWLTEEENVGGDFSSIQAWTMNQGCQDLEEIVRSCGQSYNFTVWANSPLYGLQGKRATKELTTLPCP